VTVSLEVGTDGGYDWGQIDLRDEAGIGCTHGLSYMTPEEWREWREWWEDYEILPPAAEGELVYQVDIGCYDCYDRWIALRMVFIRVTDQGDLEVTPFSWERHPSFTLAPGDPPPAEPEGQLVIDPMTVARGQKLTVAVSSFVANAIKISWFYPGGWDELYLADVDTGADGSGTFVVTVPLDVPDGPATILAEGRPAYNYCDGWITEDITVAGGPTPAPAASARPTLPPTDAASGSAVVGWDWWRLVLVGLAALVVGVLIAGSPRATSRRR
jgi:hypothetical protein